MSAPNSEESRSALDRALDFIGNLWFGITMMVLILIYCWLGSAGTQPLYDWFPRQTLDKTEMEWFTWWPFNLMVALLAISLITATIRKIPFNLPNLGVWMVHVGIIVMILGAVVYYSLKIEGDMAVYRRQAAIQVDDGPAETMILRPRESAVVRGDGRAYRVSVSSLNPSYELLTGEDKGATTYAAQLRFDPMGGGGEPFVRQLLVGYPQYTEDVIPGEGRAIKRTGSALVDEDVDVELQYAATNRLFVHSEYAIYARPAGSERWAQLPIDGLPRYHEHVATSGDAFVPQGAPQPEVGELEIQPDMSAADPAWAEGLDLSVTGYLPYATETTDWVAGGNEPNPLMTFTLSMGGASQTETLLASDPRENQISFGSGLPTITFRWLEDPAELERMRRPSNPRLLVAAPGLDAAKVVPLSEIETEPVRIEGTEYTLQLEQLFPNWQMASGSGTAQLALVRVDGPTGSFRRAVVAPHTEMSQDIVEGDHGMQGGLVDEDLRIELKGLRESGLVLVAGPVGLHTLMLDEEGVVEEHQPEMGQSVNFLDGQLELTIDRVSESARQVRKPLVTPYAERQRRTQAFSMAQVEVRQGSTARTLWLDYSHYAHPNRSGFHPKAVTLQDGERIELLFSRASIDLPTTVALEEFQLRTFPGGERERDYISLVRFQEEGGGWSEINEVRSNQPTAREGWWFFQSTWDPPAPRINYAGMNYTGLGVGNRHGVGIMLLGGILTVVGSIWAFYVKPVLIRRRRDAREEQLDVPGSEVAEPGIAPAGGHAAVDVQRDA
jgi:hypothetical protein